MNEQLQEFARSKLKSDLALCTTKQQEIFKMMYARPIPDNGTEPYLKHLSINETVDRMPEEKLDWAMQQVERTLVNKRPLPTEGERS
jgi:hypothetical protein